MVCYENGLWRAVVLDRRTGGRGLPPSSRLFSFVVCAAQPHDDSEYFGVNVTNPNAIGLPPTGSSAP